MSIRQTVLIALALPLGCLASHAVAQTTPASQARYASVYKISGTIVATDSANKQRTLKQGDAVFIGEQVRAGSNSEAVLRTEDAGIIAVRPNAAFVMEQFKAEGNATDSLSVRILSGALRMITGWTGYFNKSQHRIITPSATVGIRGTDHEPYVLSAEMSVDMQLPEGTYNKVNSGGTVLRSNGAELEVNPGRVGFAPAPPTVRPRALITVLMPVLLDKVPGFFVAGAFDAELEALAAADLAEAIKTRKLDQPGVMDPTPQQSAPTTSTTAPVVVDTSGDTANCKPSVIAATWLQELDAAVQSKDGPLFLSKFDADVVVFARVRDGSGNLVELKFTRDEVVRSTFAAFAQLTDYTSRRPATKARLAPDTRSAQCDRIDVESVAIESGRRNGATYRSETFETYRLVKRAGKWLAISATNSQR